MVNGYRDLMYPIINSNSILNIKEEENESPYNHQHFHQKQNNAYYSYSIDPTTSTSSYPVSSIGYSDSLSYPTIYSHSMDITNNPLPPTSSSSSAASSTSSPSSSQLNQGHYWGSISSIESDNNVFMNISNSFFPIKSSEFDPNLQNDRLLLRNNNGFNEYNQNGGVIQVPSFNLKCFDTAISENQNISLGNNQNISHENNQNISLGNNQNISHGNNQNIPFGDVSINNYSTTPTSDITLTDNNVIKDAFFSNDDYLHYYADDTGMINYAGISLNNNIGASVSPLTTEYSSDTKTTPSSRRKKKNFTNNSIPSGLEKKSLDRDSSYSILPQCSLNYVTDPSNTILNELVGHVPTFFNLTVQVKTESLPETAMKVGPITCSAWGELPTKFLKGGIPMYQLGHFKTPRQVLEEYFYGVLVEPIDPKTGVKMPPRRYLSIMQLEATYLTSWRDGAHLLTSKKYGRHGTFYRTAKKGLSLGYSIEEIMDIYDDYISEEVRKGKNGSLTSLLKMDPPKPLR